MSHPLALTVRVSVRAARIALPLLIALAVASAPLRADAPDSPAITAGELLDHVRVLAGDAMEGREAGAPGGQRAAEWIAARLAEFGLEGAGPGGAFLQPVPIFSVRPAPTCSLTVTRRGESRTFVVERDFVPFGFSANGAVSAPVAFAGYGITAPALSRDDYAGLDARGKVVLLLRHEPHEGEPAGDAFRRAGHSSFDRKVRNAAEHGAAGVLVVNDPLHHEADELPGMVPGRGVKIRAAFAHREVAAACLGIDVGLLGDLQRALDSGKSCAELAAATAEARLVVAFDRSPLPAANVAAWLPGSDPALAGELVVVGAHYDHLGRGEFGSLAGPGEIHNGADDNASGTAAVLEIAESLAKEGPRPKRSVLFLLFTGEEKGLLGSQEYVRHPLRPLDKTVAMLNLDMVGRSRNRSLFIGGVGTSPGFETMLRALVEERKLAARYGQGGAAPSDNTSFYMANIPALFFFTGMHPDYHRPSDDWERIDADTAADVARVAAGAVRVIANAPERPPFRAAGQPYVGVKPGEGGEGALLAQVLPGTPAQKAGLRAGDRIVTVNGKPVASWSVLQGLVGAARPGDAWKLEVVREDAHLQLELVLGER